jgi:hypothetical protein
VSFLGLVNLIFVLTIFVQVVGKLTRKYKSNGTSFERKKNLIVLVCESLDWSDGAPDHLHTNSTLSGFYL